jgi:hypothetical protein
MSAQALAGQQHDPHPPHLFLRAVAICHDRFQTTTIGRTDLDDDIFAHPADSHRARAAGIPFRILSSGFIHSHVRLSK